MIAIISKLVFNLHIKNPPIFLLPFIFFVTIYLKNIFIKSEDNIMILLIIAIAFILAFYAKVMINNSYIIKNQRKQGENLLGLVLSFNVPECIKNTFEIICMKKVNHTIAYLTSKKFNVFFEFSGVFLSLLTFLSCIFKVEEFESLYLYYFSSQSNEVGTLIISFLSITFVIIALYVSPKRMASEYVILSRLEERILNKMISELEMYQTLTNDDCIGISQDYLNQIANAEENILKN